MTNPQNMLYALSNKIVALYDLFQPDEEESDSIFEKVDNIELQMDDIVESQRRQEDLMNIIIKLLSK